MNNRTTTMKKTKTNSQLLFCSGFQGAQGLNQQTWQVQANVRVSHQQVGSGNFIHKHPDAGIKQPRDRAKNWAFKFNLKQESS